MRGKIVEAVGAAAEATATGNRHLRDMKRWLLLLFLAGCGGFAVVPEDAVEQADLGEHGHHHQH